MAYKFQSGATILTGSITGSSTLTAGDIYNKGDAQGNTYIDWNEDALGVVAGGTTNFVVSSSTVGIGTASPSSSFALDIPVSASTVRMGRLELGAWPTSTEYGFIGHSYQDHHGSGRHLKYNIAIGSGGDLNLNAVAGNDMYFRIGGVMKAAIDSNGFFGIGPNAGYDWTPSAQLHVSSSDDEMAFLCHDAQQNPVLAVTGSNRVGIGTATPNSTFQVSGSQAGNYTVITGDMTLNETHYIADLTGAVDATVTLPDVEKISGRIYHILSTGQSGEEWTLTITGSGGQFMGSSQESGPEESIEIVGSSQSVSVVSTGTYWFIFVDNRQQEHG